jgi:hypothetical protein
MVIGLKQELITANSQQGFLGSTKVGIEAGKCILKSLPLAPAGQK